MLRWTPLFIVLFVLIVTKVHAQVPQIEKDALIALYNATGGFNWTNSANWLTEEPVDTWYGVTVESGVVTRLDLSDNNLIQGIPSMIENLSSLQSLDLSNNQLIGSIPNNLGNILSLTEILLSNNNLDNFLPASLSNLNTLVILKLNNNAFSGSIPSEFEELQELVELDLSNNQIEGELPESFNGLEKLEVLNLSDNWFSGIPDLTGVLTLNTLNVNNNVLSFEDLEPNISIPEFVYSPQRKFGTAETFIIPDGENITFEFNIGGSENQYQWYKNGLPLIGVNNPSLQIISVSSENEGTYKLEIMNSIVSGLVLQSEPINLTIGEYGGVTEEDYKALETLYNTINGNAWIDNTNWFSNVGVNDWFGITVEEERVTEIVLRWNNLAGPLPPEIWQLSKLRTLDLDGNDIQGEISSDIANLILLEKLSFSANSLTGILPIEIGSLASLEIISLSENKMYGRIPVEIGNLSNLITLSLNDNNFSGSLPVELGNLSNIKYLFVHNNYVDEVMNEFSGAVPLSFQNLTNLEYFWFHNNDIEDLPDLSGLNNLFWITAENNRLDFGDLASNIGQPYYFNYIPQQNFGIQQNIDLREGESMIIGFEVGGVDNIYQWFKDDIQIVASSNQYEITSASNDDSGIYKLSVTNFSVPSLTLESESVIINVCQNEIWHLDSDGDDFGDYNISITHCGQPPGYVLDNSDCDDSDPKVNPLTIWYADADEDGYGDIGVTLIQCVQLAGYVLDNADCNDSDPEITIEKIWYSDLDGDGFGDSEDSTINCEQPTGFVSNDLDCAPSDQDVYPGAPAKADGKDNDCDGIIDKLPQTITLKPIEDLVDDGTTISINGIATSSANLDIEYILAGPATINGDVLIFSGAGKVTLTATQDGDDGYLSANPVSVSFCVNPKPEITIDETGDVTLTFTSNYNTGNQWYLNEEEITGANDHSYQVNEPGSYKLTVDIDGCLGESISVEAVLTGLDASNNHGVEIYPVPVEESLNIKMGNLLTGTSLIRIIDVSGKEWIRRKIKKTYEQTRIDVRKLPNGMYFVILQIDEKVFVKKIVKQ